MNPETIPGRLMRHAQSRPEAPAHFTREAGQWRPLSWREYAQQVRQVGRALMALGLEPGATACILGSNRSEWVLFDVACMAIGAVPAGIYTTSSAEELAYIAQHAESPVLLLEGLEAWEKVRQVLGELPHLRHVVMMKGAPPVDDARVLSWEALLARGEEVPQARFEERLEALEPDGLATLIYTSGTTGPPKGVMLSHRNLAWMGQRAAELVGARESDCCLSYLPLSHIAEQMFSIHMALSAGYAVYFVESAERFMDNLREVQPTLFVGVPRVWEKFHEGVGRKLADTRGARRALLDWAQRVGRQVASVRNRSGRPGPLLALAEAAAGRLVHSKLKQALGMGRIRVCGVGAAPIAREVLEFFSGLGLTLQEVYGQSEGTGITTANRLGRVRLGSAGEPLPGVEVRLAEDGEVLLRGPNVFLGYFKDARATAEVLVDGWLHSGDMGSLDAEGFLSITGRKKDILITSGGKNITPSNIESALKAHPLISEAVLIGDRRKYLSVLLVLETEAARRLLAERGLEGDPLEHPAVRAEVQAALDEVNARLARVETVKRFCLLPRPLSVEHGELTATLKVKRAGVARSFAAQIEALYAEPEAGRDAA